MRPPWVTQYLGRRYSDDFNCWALVRLVTLEVFGRWLPTQPLTASDFRRAVEVKDPRAGDIAWTRVGQSHAGVMISSTEVLHCSRQKGSCIQPITDHEFSRARFFRLL